MDVVKLKELIADLEWIAAESSSFDGLKETAALVSAREDLIKFVLGHINGCGTLTFLKKNA